MPTYEYQCKSCKHSWEEDQSIMDERITVCPDCKKESAMRLISGGTGFILQGGGWFSEGYSNK